MKQLLILIVVITLTLVFIPTALGNWNGGHDVMGIFQAKKTWYFAEGCTRYGFNTWLCLHNPGTTDGVASIEYSLENGEIRNCQVAVGKQSRTTVDVGHTCKGEHDVASTIRSSVPIVAERSIYFNHNGYMGGSCVMGSSTKNASWYFAEGTTIPGFQEWLCILNPSSERTASVNIKYMIEDQSQTTLVKTQDINPSSRFTQNVRDIVGDNKNVSIKVSGLSSEDTVVCERSMYFNYQNKWNGGHDSLGANQLSKTWYFAEGCTRDGFDTWLTLQNPDSISAKIKITYMLASGKNIKKVNSISPNTRKTINVVDEIGREQDVSIKVESSNLIAAERPMYFNYQKKWDGGSDSFGCLNPHTISYFAEGCSRQNFETWLCILNPNNSNLTVNVSYSNETGNTIHQPILVSANSRATVNANLAVGPEHDFSIKVESQKELVVERSMYFDYQGKPPISEYSPPTNINGQITNGNQLKMDIALTFDAGSGAEYATTILDELKAANLRCTIFVTGEFAAIYPDILKRIVADGHEVGNHSYSHPDFLKLSAAEVQYQLVHTEETINAIAGVSTKPYFRFPYGNDSESLINEVNANGYLCVRWAADTIDWDPNTTCEQIQARVARGTAPGAIILMHLGSPQEGQILPVLIQSLQNQGYNIVTISELLSP